jgi:hypothetical protein
VGTIQRRVEQLRGASPTDAARLAYRKAIYRKVQLGQMGVPAGRSILPANDHGLTLEFWGPDRFDEILGTTPYLDAADLADFRRQRSTVIVALDGDRIAGSSWMTSGEVQVHELHRPITVPAGQHFSCRSYVDRDYGGRALLSHMIHAYSAAQDPDDLVWGLVYAWNVASVRSLAKIGWEWFGDYWTSFVLGRKVPGERHFAARPGMDLADER